MIECRHNKQQGVYHLPGIHFWTAGQRIDTSIRSTFVWRERYTYTDIEKVSLMRYTNWVADYPNAPDTFGANEACVDFWRTITPDPDNVYNNHWNDRPCSFAMCSICEIDM